MPLPVLSWLSALGGRFEVLVKTPSCWWGVTQGSDHVPVAQYLLLLSLPLRCLLFLPGGSS